MRNFWNTINKITTGRLTSKLAAAKSPHDCPDEEIIDAENKIGYLETVVDYIKGVIKSIDNRGWDIKNAIEWKKFEAGVTY